MLVRHAAFYLSPASRVRDEFSGGVAEGDDKFSVGFVFIVAMIEVERANRSRFIFLVFPFRNDFCCVAR